jgi:CRP-like cAMP-binding protein
MSFCSGLRSNRLTRDGNKLFLRWGAPGDAFGLATIVSAPARYLVTIEAVEEGSILAWDLAACQALIARCPSLSKAVNWTVSNYLDSLIDMFGMCQLQTAEKRLARVLIETAGQLGHSGPEGIEVKLNNEEVALAAHISLFTATRHLGNLQPRGALKKYRSKVVLQPLSCLRRTAKIVSDKSLDIARRPRFSTRLTMSSAMISSRLTPLR